MDDQDHNSLPERATAFLKALKEASELEGFAVQPKTSLVAGERWQTAMEVTGTLGTFLLTLWTSWSFLAYDGDICRLELSLGEKEFLPVYRCTGVDEFLQDLEYLKLIAEQTSDPQELVSALKRGADPKWRVSERDKFVALKKYRSGLGFVKTVGSA